MFGLDKFPCSQMEKSSKSVFIKNRLALLTRYCSKCPVEFRFCNGADCVQARIQGGGIWGTCPPLEPNAQRKNLRRLKDLRGPIQRKSPKLST